MPSAIEILAVRTIFLSLPSSGTRASVRSESAFSAVSSTGAKLVLGLPVEQAAKNSANARLRFMVVVSWLVLDGFEVVEGGDGVGLGPQADFSLGVIAVA